MSYRAVFILLTAMLLSSGACSAADPAPLITLVGGTTQALLPSDKGTLSTRIPISVRGEVPIDVKVVDVVYKDGHSGNLVSAFSATYQPATAATGSSFLVEATKVASWPGAYVLSLAASQQPIKGGQPAAPATKAASAAKSGQPAESTTQVVSITLQVPAPQVTASTKVVVAQTLPFFWFGGGTSDGVLVLSEQSQKTRARDLTPIETHDPPAHGEPDTASLTFSPRASDASFPEPTRFLVRPSGEFPLGVTSGRIDIRSPSLASAVSLPFEVRVRWSLYLLTLIAIGGTTVGYNLRTRMNAKQDLLTARTAITGAVRAALRAKSLRADVAFRADVDKVILSLSDAQATEIPKDMQDAAKKAITDIQALCTTFDARLPGLKKQLDDLQGLTTFAWRLPPSLDSAVGVLSAQVQAFADLINQSNFGDADAAFVRLTNSSTPLLGRAVVDYLSALANYMQAVVASPFPLTAVGTKQLAQACDTAVAKSQSATSMGSQSVTDVATLLRAADAAYNQASTFANSAKDFSTSLCASASTALREAFVGTDVEFKPITDLAEKYASDFGESGIKEPVPAIVSVDNTPIKAAWKSLLLQLTSNAPSDKIDEALNEAHWMDAVQLAIASKTIVPAAHGMTLRAGGDIPAHAVDDLSDASDVAFQASDPKETEKTSIDLALEIDDADRTLKTLKAQSLLIAKIQSVAFGAIFIASAYLLYADSWVGTGKEIVTIFTLAFSIDLTSDGIIAALKKLV